LWAELALERSTAETPPDTVLRLKESVASAWQVLRPRTTAALSEEILPALRQAGDPARLGDALAATAHALRMCGRIEEAQACVTEAEAAIADLPASRATVAVRLARAFLLHALDDSERWREQMRSAAQLARSIGAEGWASLVTTQRLYGDLDADAETALAETRAVLEQIRPTHMFADGMMSQASLAAALRLATRNAPGDLDEAWRLVQSLEKTDGRALTIAPSAVEAFVRLALSDGRPTDAARVFGAMNARAVQLGINNPYFDRVQARARHELQSHMSDATFEAHAAEGARLSDEQLYVLATNQYA
jgi:hypothetical protein